MRRLMLMLALLICPALRAAQPERRVSELGGDPKTQPAAARAGMAPVKPIALPEARLVPALEWRPREGREASTWSSDGKDVLATGDEGSCRILSRAMSDGDNEAIGRLKDSRTAFPVAGKTRVRIEHITRAANSIAVLLKTTLLDGKDRGATAWFPAESVKYLVSRPISEGDEVRVGKATSGGVIFAKDRINHQTLTVAGMQQNKRSLMRLVSEGCGKLLKGGFTATVLESRNHALGNVLNVRVLDGPEKDSEGWVSAKIAVITKRDDAEDRPSTRIEADLRLGEKFEKDGRQQAAIDSYRRVIEADPKSREAALAEDRIVALGARP